VVYLYVDRWRRRSDEEKHLGQAGANPPDLRPEPA